MTEKLNSLIENTFLSIDNNLISVYNTKEAKGNFAFYKLEPISNRHIEELLLVRSEEETEPICNVIEPQVLDITSFIGYKIPNQNEVENEEA